MVIMQAPALAVGGTSGFGRLARLIAEAADVSDLLGYSPSDEAPTSVGDQAQSSDRPLERLRGPIPILGQGRVERKIGLLSRCGLLVAEKRFRRLDAPHLLKDVFEGRKFEDGKPVSTQQRKN